MLYFLNVFSQWYKENQFNYNVSYCKINQVESLWRKQVKSSSVSVMYSQLDNQVMFL